MFSNFSFSSLGNAHSAITFAIIALVIMAIIIILKITKLNFLALIKKFLGLLIKIFGKFINKKETAYHRDIEIGKITEKRTRYKLYRFLSDLIIDLGMTKYDMKPYELLWLTIVIVTLIVTLLCKLVLSSLLIAIILVPIAIVGTFCVMYTKANIAHDSRIEAVIEAENVICNNIKAGVVVAVRESLDVLPKSVRPDFKDFIDNIEQKNYHIKTALLELNSRLGNIADDFIKKCIVFETEEEHGMSGMFGDIVEINNIKTEMRTNMKRKFEEVKSQFIIGAAMIFVFLAGVLIIYPDVRNWYLTTGIGKVVIAVDVLLLIIEFVYITYLRAKEL